jgi:hypothetical protein
MVVWCIHLHFDGCLPPIAHFLAKMGGDFTPLFLIILSLSSKYVMLDGMIHSIDSSFCYENEVFKWFRCYLAREVSKHAARSNS